MKCDGGQGYSQHEIMMAIRGSKFFEIQNRSIRHFKLKPGITRPPDLIIEEISITTATTP